MRELLRILLLLHILCDILSSDTKEDSQELVYPMILNRQCHRLTDGLILRPATPNQIPRAASLDTALLNRKRRDKTRRIRSSQSMILLEDPLLKESVAFGRLKPIETATNTNTGSNSNTSSVKGNKRRSTWGPGSDKNFPCINQCI